MGNEKKLKVYCETTFWSYLNGRPMPLQHIAIKQAATLPVTASIIAKPGYRCPIIITPLDFIERKEEFGYGE